MLKNRLSLLPLILLYGCAHFGIVDYHEPTQGPRARVRFVTTGSRTRLLQTSNESTVLAGYDDADCGGKETFWMTLRDKDQKGPAQHDLGLPLWDYSPSGAQEVYVPVDKPLAAMFWGVKIGPVMEYCAVPFSFPFAENHDYEVKFNWSPTQCNVEVSQFVSEDGSWSKQVVGRFDNRETEPYHRCFDLFRKRHPANHDYSTVPIYLPPVHTR